MVCIIEDTYVSYYLRPKIFHISKNCYLAIFVRIRGNAATVSTKEIREGKKPCVGPRPGYTTVPLNCSGLVLGGALCKRDRPQFKKRNHQFLRARISLTRF